MKRILLFLVLLCIPAFASAERIVVVGDSITGHSMNLPCGYTHRVRLALQEAGVTDVEFVPLGGSGQTVSSWRGIVDNSYKNRQRLDIPDIYVKDEFDKGADTILIFLGMNDAHCPSISNADNCYDVWKEEFQDLINKVKARCPYKKLILSAPTMLTESPYDFKNLQMDKMESVVRQLAKENGATVCEIRRDFKAAVENARKQDVEYRVIRDYVHPRELGHDVMTVAILRAIGQDKAADMYLEKYCSEYQKDFQKPGMSLYVVSPAPIGKAIVRGNLRGADKSQLTVDAPEGYKVDKIELGEGEEFTIYLSGSSEELTTYVTVKTGDIVRKVKLNAPYRLAMGFYVPPFGNEAQFNKDAAVTQIDKDVLDGKNPLESTVDGKPVEWFSFFPSVDYTGGDDPNNIDFYAVDNCYGFEGAYFVREVYSPEEQKVRVDFAANSYSTNEMVTLYCNQDRVYEHFFSRGGKTTDSTEITLKKGWNRIVGRTTHTTWQWVISVSFNGNGLKYR